MVVLTATSGEALVRPGVYDAIIVEVAEKERDGRKFLVWTFEVRYSGSKTTRVRKPTSMSFGPKSAARSIVEAALGRKLRDGEQIDTDDLVGCRVQVVITRGTRPDGSETNTVESVLPAKDEDDLPF
jgi:predicted alpha/beta-hydrolase family hydrolase